ncbi:lysosomal acid phosphatase-like [Arctopsyche grandis]|uniref:lysosomal acid phosphatase-like n=1 Tax=Arctopsyche grandis TaxID=121162 RepID=UPI00406D83FB
MLPLNALFFIVVSMMTVTSEMQPTSVVILYRHGDRTPVDPYPLDPWRNPSYWPVGFGQLTDRGKLQHYELGKILRNKYKHLIGSKFDPKTVHIQSTDFDRTLMSAEANLAGMFPINETEAPIPGLLWQPIPIHTMPQDEDHVLMIALCPKFDVEQQKFFDSPFFQKLNEGFQQYYRYVTNHTGRYIDNIVDMSYIYDNLHIEEMNGFALPEWTKEVYPDVLKNITKYSFILNTYTPTLAKLKIGPFLKELTEQMVSPMSQFKIKVLSAHDTTIASILNGLNLKSFEMPPYASNLIFEIYANQYPPSVRILYQMEELVIPKCGVMCPLSQFITNYAHLISKNYSEECRIDSPETLNYSILTLYSVIFIFGAAIIILLIFIILIFIKRSKISQITPKQ